MPNRTPRVLYVDDDAGLARLVQKALERRGYFFEHASNGEDGLARIRQGGIDIVALDHYLPAGTGLDVLAQMVGIQDPPAVVYVTGTAETAVAVAALKAGAADYVLKTVDSDFLELLCTAIGQAVELLRLSRAKVLAEREMREARERAEMLLGEVNHRVANSLAMVAALVGLQANAVDNEEARGALAETQVRIQAIAGVHRHLYTSDDVRSVHIGDYLHSLAAELEATMQAAGNDSRILVSVENFAIPTEKAASIGVVVTELVTNAIKYAYADQARGEVRILMSRGEGETIDLSVEDDGIGWDGTGKPQGTGLGSRIVKAMAHSLGARVAYGSAGGGTKVSLRFTA
ncbi:histidine kinase dimerization/phosphoacceptor domain -containing protein [Devosia sp. Root635]|uniref:histidine kinase dimerization/phosphoacceptor domain -containing protein n=1 Tax=Devosia sp. Root635 TaxID=1736575 RepID=UPI0006FC939B|nr:histidine kinase dimerization/phosphoacceptor domain -containing protein [Devosia sp. Root635]KRA50220.1 two-component system sensor histidine kinase/response regulator [Devosia sp. Root635]